MYKKKEYLKLILILLLILGNVFDSNAQISELNLSFEQFNSKTKLPLGWKFENISNVICEIDTNEKWDGQCALYIKRDSLDLKKDIFCSISFPCSIAENTWMEGKVWLKRRNVEEVSTGSIHLFFQFDIMTGMIGLPEFSTQDWTLYSIKAKVPYPIKTFSWGVLFGSKGEIWVDGLELFLNGKKVVSQDSLYQEKSFVLIDSLVSTNVFIAPYRPLPASAIEIKKSLIKEHLEIKNLPVDSVKAHRSSVNFPGKVLEQTLRINRKVRITHQTDTGNLGLNICMWPWLTDIWYSTGLYAVAGEKLVIKIPERLKNKIRVQIGSHKENLSSCIDINWKRLPCILLDKIIQDTITEIVSPYGGLIYITCPVRMESFSTMIKIQNAIASPWYILGKTTQEEWEDMLRTSGAPWGELETNTLILTLPISVLREITSPEYVAMRWDEIIRSMYELSQMPVLGWKQRIVTDIQIGKGADIGGLSGYPISLLNDPKLDVHSHLILVNPDRMSHLPECFAGLAVLHELGHNMQNGNATFKGMEEITNNLFALYIYDCIFGSRVGAHKILTDSIPTKYLLLEDFTHWKQEPALGYMIFYQLQSAFGWEPFKVVFRHFKEVSYTEKILTDQEKIDHWVLYFSKAIQKNLAPYFLKCNIQVSPKVKEQLKSYPSWMPKILKKK